MSDESTDPGSETSGEGTTDAEQARVDAYDLDGDGEVGVVEEMRATLGVVDARLEEIADEGGVTGKIADAVHHVVDKLDND